MSTTTDLTELVINYLTEAQYEAAVSGGTIDPDQLYLTPETNVPVTDVEVNGTSVVSSGVAEVTVPTTAAEVGAVPTSRTVNGKALSSNITLSASDVSALPSSTVIPTITDTYSGTSSNGMSGKAVKSAIDALDGSVSGSAGSGKTLTAFSQTNGVVSATFGNISITKSQVSDFPSIPSKTSDLQNDSGFITGYTETDPTVPSWAKEASKPSYSASEIGGLTDFFYPVGSYYETSDASFDPNVSWGGTWVLETSGQVHVSAGTGYTIGATGGATTSATESHTLTASEIPAHTHGSKSLSGSWYMTGVADATVGTTGIVTHAATSNGSYTGNSSNTRAIAQLVVDATHEHTSVGGGGGHSHGSVSTMQPYIVVNRWHRTA